MKEKRNLVSFAGAVILSFVVLGRIQPLLAQGPQTPSRPETVPLKTVPVKFDKDYGAAIARFGDGKYGEGRLHQLDATLVELAPGQKLEAHKHLAEEMVYVVSGEGYTNMWLPGSNTKTRYDWSESDVISPTVNSWHEHGNSSTTEPARFLVMTSTPLMQRMFGNEEFYSSSDFVFEERWKKGLEKPKFLDRSPGRNGGEVDQSLMSIGHFIPDMMNMKMPIAFGDPEYPEDGINVVPPQDDSTGADALGGMAGNRLFEWQNREVTKVDGKIHGEGDHHHAWEVVYFVPKGEMITYLTAKGEDQPQRKISWKAGDMIIVEADEIHQHELPVKGTRFLQFKLSGYFRGVGIQAMGGRR